MLSTPLVLWFMYKSSKYLFCTLISLRVGNIDLCTQQTTSFQHSFCWPQYCTFSTSFQLIVDLVLVEFSQVLLVLDEILQWLKCLWLEVHKTDAVLTWKIKRFWRFSSWLICFYYPKWIVWPWSLFGDSFPFKIPSCTQRGHYAHPHAWSLMPSP